MFEREPAKYFYGREDVLKRFDELAKKSKAVTDGWHIARIKSGALWDKQKMFRALGFWSLPQLYKELSLEISLTQLVKGGRIHI